MGWGEGRGGKGLEVGWVGEGWGEGLGKRFAMGLLTIYDKVEGRKGWTGR